MATCCLTARDRNPPRVTPRTAGADLRVFLKNGSPGVPNWLASNGSLHRPDRAAETRRFPVRPGSLQQLTLSEFLASGDYDRYLKTLRPVLQRNAQRMAAFVAQSFPEETRTSHPVGGSVLWIELPASVDSETLFDRAIVAGISIAPGNIFAPGGRYANFVRLSFGHPWTAEIENAIGWLGREVSSLAS